MSTKRRPVTKIKIQLQPLINLRTTDICLSNQFNEGLKNSARVKENPASDPISPPTLRHHKDVPILKLPVIQIQLRISNPTHT